MPSPSTTSCSRGSDLGDWVAALHQADSPDGVLSLLLAAAVQPVCGRYRKGFILRPSVDGSTLGGWLGLGHQETDESGEPIWFEGWRALADSGELENISPQMTGTVRCLEFGIEERSDITTACFVDGNHWSGPADDGEVSPLWADRLGLEHLLVIPLCSQEETMAVLVCEPQPTAEIPGGENDESVLFLCEQAGHAMSRLESVVNARDRQAQLSTLREAARTLLLNQSLSSGLSKLLHNVCQAVSARGGTLWLTDTGGRGVYLAKIHLEEDGVDEEALGKGLRCLAEDIIWRRDSPFIEDPRLDERIGKEAADLGAILGAPIVAREQPRGAFILYGGRDSAGFRPQQDRSQLEHYAALAGILAEYAQLSMRAKDAEKKLNDALGNRLRLESLADLGETSIRMAREMSNPLASVTGFARRVQRTMAEEDPNREYLEIVVREGERLERMLTEHMQFASLSRSRLGMSNLNHILQVAMSAVEPEIAKRRVRLLKKLSPRIPSLLLDEEKIQQAIENILKSALQGLPVGGRLLVQSREGNGNAVVEVCHDGPPVGNDVLEQLFVPFSTGGRNGIGLGLSVAQRVVHDHGGEIGVKARGDWGHIVALSLPVGDNQDRRRHADRRRLSANDRRNRFPLR